jgi:hypothetical protein
MSLMGVPGFSSAPPDVMADFAELARMAKAASQASP